MKSIVFDFDGVLGDTHNLIINFLTTKFFFTPKMADSMIRKSMFSFGSDSYVVWVFKKYFYRRLYKKLAKTKENYLFQAQIDQLDSLMVPKAIISHNHTQTCVNILGNQKSKFQAIYGMNNSKNKVQALADLVNSNPNFDLENLIFVTDTVADILEINQILPKNQIFAVNYGFCTQQELAPYLPKNQIISNLSELNQFI